jgi:2-hydroxy-3-keto-5-methylthiopentenyl-1-phosphate phosphatase
VFLDFDGTISREDVGTYVLERVASGRFEAIDARYERGEIGSRQCIRELWPLLRVERSRLDELADEVPLDPGLGPLVGFVRRNGGEVVVVSDGLGFYVARRCAPFGVPVFTNGVVDGRPQFPHADRGCPCGLCGTCKPARFRGARRRGRSCVFVGDGTSDRFAAAEADVVFAKDRLVDWCRAEGLDFEPFHDLCEVEAGLRRLGAGPDHPSTPS